MAVISKTPITGCDGVLSVTNGTVTTTLAFTKGDLKISKLNGGMAGSRKTVQTVTDFFARGRWIAAKFTSDEIVEITFTGFLVGMKGVASDPAIIDFVVGSGDWAGASSTVSAARGDVTHATFVWTVERTNFGATTDDVVTAKYCSAEVSIEESDEGSTISVKLAAKPVSSDWLAIT